MHFRTHKIISNKWKKFDLFWNFSVPASSKKEYKKRFSARFRRFRVDLSNKKIWLFWLFFDPSIFFSIFFLFQKKLIFRTFQKILSRFEIVFDPLWCRHNDVTEFFRLTQYTPTVPSFRMCGCNRLCLLWFSRYSTLKFWWRQNTPIVPPFRMCGCNRL